MATASIDSIESFSVIDGPGIRSVIFLNGCMLRCKYCHNPETWMKGRDNITDDEIVQKIERFKPYYGNNGGVTFSGGEPLLQTEFLISCSKKLKKENIHIALDTAGEGIGSYQEILENIDLIIFDIKHTDKNLYKELTGAEMKEVHNFLKVATTMHKKFWIRQVIVPNMMDNESYLKSLNEYIKKYFYKEDILKIEFLPFHTLGKEKYIKLNIPYPLKNTTDMDVTKCQKLYEKFMEEYYNKEN